LRIDLLCRGPENASAAAPRRADTPGTDSVETTGAMLDLQAATPVAEQRAAPQARESDPMQKSTFRVVTRGTDGQIRIRDYDSPEDLLRRHVQIGVDDCSTDLGLRGLPVFRGLIGPMPEDGNVIRYESPEVFETLTKQWDQAAPSRRTRRASGPSKPAPHVSLQAPSRSPARS
jgi:hypothetical protein